MPHLKLKNKLLLIFVSLNLVCAGILTAAVYSEMRPHFLEAVEYTLIDTSRLLASQFAVDGELNPGKPLNKQRLRLSAEKLLSTHFPGRNYFDRINQSKLQFYVTDEKGIVLFDSQNPANEGRDFSSWRDVALTLRGEYGARASRINAMDPNTSVHFVAAPIVRNGKVAGVVSVGKPTESVSGFLTYSKYRLVMIALISFVISIIASLVASYWISRPVRRLEQYVLGLKEGRTIAFPELSRDEIGDLAQSFENLRKELEGKSYVEKYVHNLTHEIKSPVTSLIGAAELLSGDSLTKEDQLKLHKNIRSESLRLKDIAEKLLELASVEARDRAIQLEKFDLGLLLEEVTESYDGFAQSEQISVSLQGPSEILVDGERFLIWRAVANLIQNAIEFSPQGGKVLVRFDRDQDGAWVEVKDAGSGIPDYALSKVTDRFFSLERPRTGKKSSGLGLSFVKEVMTLHQGSLSFQSQSGTIARLQWSSILQKQT